MSDEPKPADDAGLLPSLMVRIFGKSWLTTVTGFLGGIAIVAVPILTSGRMPSKEEWTTAAILAVFGLVTKSYNKTGT